MGEKISPDSREGPSTNPRASAFEDTGRRHRALAEAFLETALSLRHLTVDEPDTDITFIEGIETLDMLPEDAASLTLVPKTNPVH